MLYLNARQTYTEEMLADLTLTSVVFEFIMIITTVIEGYNLTLTSVVFELHRTLHFYSF